MNRSCWFKAVEGYSPDEWVDCKHDCCNCSYYLPDLPEPDDKKGQDELP